jgi:CheY-like chemotaxis protein
MKKKLHSCCGKPYKLIFVDLNMPVLSGFEMMQEIKDLQDKGLLLEY